MSTRPTPLEVSMPASAHGRLVALIILGFLVRLAVLSTGATTSDEVLWNQFAAILATHNVGDAYSYHSELNHPPLALGLIRVLAWVAGLLSIQLGSVIKLAAAVSDVASMGALISISNQLDTRGRGGPYIHYFSPLTVVVAVIHCNLDSMMIALMLVACAALLSRSYVLAAIALGLASGIKIVPLLVLPVILGHVRFHRRFVAWFVATFFIPYLLIGGPTPGLIRNVFLYPGYGNPWSIPLLLRSVRCLAIETLHDSRAFTVLGETVQHLSRPMALGCVAIIGMVALARGVEKRSLTVWVATTYLCLLMFAPGVAVHHLFWPLAFLAVDSSRKSLVAVHSLLLAYTGAIYTFGAHSLWWRFVDLGVASKLDGISLCVLYAVSIPAWIGIAALSVLGCRRVLASIDLRTTKA